MLLLTYKPKPKYNGIIDLNVADMDTFNLKDVANRCIDRNYKNNRSPLLHILNEMIAGGVIERNGNTYRWLC